MKVLVVGAGGVSTRSCAPCARSRDARGGALRARQRRHRRATPACSKSPPRTSRRSSPPLERERVDFTWSAPRRRWWPASSTPSRRAASRVRAQPPPRPSSRPPRRSPRRPWRRPACPTAALPPCPHRRGGPRRRPGPRRSRLVVKADGLAAGKGVVVAASPEQAREALREIFVEHRFGGDARRASWSRSCLVGDELSLLALCDGERAMPARSRPRLQAHRRRRHRPQHRRHGRLLARRRHRRGGVPASSSHPSTSPSSTGWPRAARPSAASSTRA